MFQIPVDILSLEDDVLSLEQPRDFANHLLDDDDNYKVHVK
jgi:hypothetical protein